MLKIQEIQEKLFGVNLIPDDIMNIVHKQQWLRIWIPKEYQGLGCRFHEGLKVLKTVAKIDGSLGWMVTLCSGANYFSRNLKPQIAQQIFTDSKACFGGSGMLGGTAKIKEGKYQINGTWHFATGAPHLTHFTLNAMLMKDGNAIMDENGNEQFKSFVIPKTKVTIIPNWKSMGMKATGTYSFSVENVDVEEDFSFVYNEFFTHSVLDKIPFRIFADLTLLVNYLGMAEHFVEEAKIIRPRLDFSNFIKFIKETEVKTENFALEIEKLLRSESLDLSEKQTEIHQFGEESVSKLSHELLEIYFQLGTKATHDDEPIHQIFNDFFTATQHANFRKDWKE